MQILTKILLPLSVALMLNACAGKPQQQNNAEFYLSQAKAHLAQNNRAAAIKSLDQAIILDPTNADYYARRGHIYTELNEISTALPDINKALQLDPKHHTASFNLAQILAAEGKYNEALNAINHAILLSPNNSRYLGARCVILVARDASADGLKDCNAGIAIKNGESNAYTARGQANLLLNKNKLAQADFDAALKYGPNNMRALYGRGLARQKQGDAQNGAADIETAVARLPGAGREFAIKVGSL